VQDLGLATDGKGGKRCWKGVGTHSKGKLTKLITTKKGGESMSRGKRVLSQNGLGKELGTIKTS